ncbi:MAG: hypothetical protein H0V45_08420 [Actinobacteria bacterium]|nr:hypothetical protein [Actinomycetota bacterium]
MDLPGRGRKLQRQRLPDRAGLIAAALAVGVAGIVAAAAAGRGGQVSYAGDVQPLLDRKCTACHPVSYPYLDLRRGRSYDELVRVPAKTAPAFARVLPGRPELSYLLTHPPDPSLRNLLTGDERELLIRWIREGARDD